MPLTTKQLVQWVLDAEDVHEASWNDKTTRYKLTMSKAIDKTSPHRTTRGTSSTPPSLAERQLAIILITHYWNDCQDWIKDL